MRRRYITHPRFQFLFVLAYVRGALLSIGGGALLLAGALYFLLKDPSLRPEQIISLTDALPTIALVFGGVAGVTLIVAIFLGVYLSYKMAGPIRRLEDWLVQKNTSEDVPPLFLRPGDEWIPTVELLNRLVNK